MAQSQENQELMKEMQRFQSERANQIRKEALSMLKNASMRRGSGGSGKGSQRRPQLPRGR